MGATQGTVMGDRGSAQRKAVEGQRTHVMWDLPCWKHMAVIFKPSPSQKRFQHKCFQLHLTLWTGTPEDGILAASSLNAHQRKSRKEQLGESHLGSLDVSGAVSLLIW